MIREQIAQITARHPGIAKARLTVDRDGDNDVMTLAVESDGIDADAVEATMRDILKLRGTVQTQATGTLPNDGKVIDDIRKFD